MLVRAEIEHSPSCRARSALTPLTRCGPPGVVGMGFSVSGQQTRVPKKQTSVSRQQTGVSKKQTSVARKHVRVSRKQASVSKH